MRRTIAIPGRWLVHAYYTVSPYAPDETGRLLAAGADPHARRGEVLVLSDDGTVLDRFGEGPIEASFFHTGRWQTWSQDARYIYYTAGTLHDPSIVRREVATGREVRISGDLEGAPPVADAPLLSGLLGMLHAAGAGDGVYRGHRAPVPFAARDRHGLFRYDFDAAADKAAAELVLPVARILDEHPERDRVLAADERQRSLTGDGLSLMAYCVRWNGDGSRLIFHFGNHLAAKGRGEERVGYVMTARPDLSEISMAVDLSFGRPGLHWSWQPDGQTLLGYGPDPENPAQACLAEVRHDGSGYRRLSSHASGGHPSASPVERDLLVTDEWTPTGGNVVFLSRSTGEVVATVELPRFLPDAPPGRSRFRTDHHPVFHPDGDRVLVNALPGELATLVELDVPG
ncbi:hypothetical protein [Jiangella endophytica]|uniref:hypothetical protein n=1 Tax=Jiangella endophytica TaxID=1623398 RepID=UPI000E345A09|nr:hypothetical protein [Jiangella endophytica]